MSQAVVLLTPSHRGDVERFALLCDSIDRFVTGYERHYVIVDDDDVAFFARFDNDRRVVLPSSQLLPRWLKLLPPYFHRGGRRTWWSFRSWPLHGWHIQQLLKISGALRLPHERYCMIDSDNVFFRPFDVAGYAGGELIPLYFDPNAIRADAPLHAVWMRNCDRLLGGKTTAFPTDDYIGNMIVWDKSALRDMTQTIEDVTGAHWAVALCRTRAFSEYLLYGRFVRHSPIHGITHRASAESPVASYWEAEPLNSTALATMIRKTRDFNVALCLQSFSSTPVPLIRKAVGL